jgi:hypothetical protein
MFRTSRAMTRIRTASRLAAVTLLAACSGCGPGGPELADVTGTVTLDGKPVQGAILEFIPQEPGKSTAWGSTDEDGRYEMAFGQSRQGAFPGRTLVRITSDDRVSLGGEKYEFTELFPPKYNAQSEQYVDVASGENEIDFRCESGEHKPRQRKGSGGGA